MPETLEIKPAYEDLDEIKELFREYVSMLGVDLGFQGYEEELAGLPGKYAPPGGRLYLALCGGRPAGCVALRQFATDIRNDGYAGACCEMKRLFVRPAFRGCGAGWALAETAVAGARDAGYRRILLDTLSVLEQSHGIYRRLGFRETGPYYRNPLPGVLYFRLDLDPEEVRRS